MSGVQGMGDGDLLRSLVLDGKKLDARLIQAVTSDGPLRRSISEPTSLNLTLNDPERFLAQGGYYERRADLLLDDLWFRMVRVEKAADQFTVEFNDREIVMLAGKTRPRRASRADLTRAEFLRSLVREVPHIGFVCPALRRRQPIATLPREQQRELDRERARGIARDAKLKIKGVTAKPSQIDLLNRALRRAEKRGAGEKATVALIEALITESGVANLAGGDRDSRGVLQVRDSTARSMGIDNRDVEECVDAFLQRGFYGKGGAIALARENRSWTAAQVAQAVQGSAFADGSNYAAYADEARKIYAAYGGVDQGPDSDTGGGQYVAQYQYSRGQPGGPRGENTWACGTRLSEEVAWRWFCVAGFVYFISDYDLIRSMPRMTLNERSPGVHDIDYALDVGDKIPDTVTIHCRASRWAAPPGTVVVLDPSMSPADGAWIVTEIERESLTNPEASITLTRPAAPQREPASEVLSRDTGDETSEGGRNAGDTRDGSRGRFTLQPGANRSGASLTAAMTAFLEQVAGQTNEDVVVTSGTNHSQFSSSGNVSAHWTGNGADVAVGGDARNSSAAGSKGDNIAVAALVVCGKNRSEARRLATSGALNFSVDFAWTYRGKTYRVEIGWRTLVGGNHFNHVHFGLS